MSGDITISAGDLLQSPDSMIEASGAISGTITITTREQDVAGQLAVLEGAFLDAGSLLRQRCAARRDIGASSFTGVGRGGLPASPDGPLLTSYPIADDASADAGQATAEARPIHMVAFINQEPPQGVVALVLPCGGAL